MNLKTLILSKVRAIFNMSILPKEIHRFNTVFAQMQIFLELGKKSKTHRELQGTPESKNNLKKKNKSGEGGIPRWQLEGGSRKQASYSEILERHQRHTLQA
jgi:hypothetical protein